MSKKNKNNDIETSLDRLEELGKLQKEKMQVKQQVRQFLQRNGAYNQLQALVNVFAPTKRKDLSLRVNVGGGSYTDGKVVVVGLFDSMWTLKKHEIFSGLKALTAHEVGHVLHSDFEAFVEFQEKVADYFQDNHGIDPKISKEIARGIANSIEDGRIERLMGQSFRGIVPNIRHMRAIWWEEQAIPEETQVAEFSVWSTCILTLAATGLWPKGMDIEKYEEAYNETIKVLPWVQAGILSNDPNECLDYCWEIIMSCKDFILKEIQATQDFMDLLNKLMEAHTSQFENNRDESGDGQAQMGEDEDGEGGTHIDPRLISSDALKELAKNMKSKKNQQKGQSSSGGGMSGSSSSSDENEDEGQGKGSSANGEEEQEGKGSSANGEEEQEGKGSSTNGQEEGQEEEQGDSNGSNGEGEETSSSENSSNQDENQTSSQSNTEPSQDDLRPRNSHEEMTKEMISEEEVRPATPETYNKIMDELRRRHEENAQKDVEAAEKFDESEEKIRQAREEKARREQAKIDKNLDEIRSQFKQRFSYHDIPFSPRPVRLPNEIISKGKRLNNHFQTVLNQDPEEDFARYKKGSLDTSALWRVSTNEKRLFNRREPDTFTCAVSLLIDGSGSMDSSTRYYDEYSTRFKDALRAGAIIEEALKGLVSLDITVFTATNQEVTHHTLKNFDEQSKHNHCWSFYEEHRSPFWGNADGWSIGIVGDKLKKRHEDQKILFVISDGLPAFSDGVEETRRAVQNLKQSGVKVIGIGVGNEALQYQDDFIRMYEKQSVLIETEKITDYLIRYLGKLLA